MTGRQKATGEGEEVWTLFVRWLWSNLIYFDTFKIAMKFFLRKREKKKRAFVKVRISLVVMSLPVDIGNIGSSKTVIELPDSYRFVSVKNTKALLDVDGSSQ